MLRPIIEKKDIDVKVEYQYDECENLKVNKVYKEIFISSYVIVG